jgi:hypothetical protein
MHAGFWQFSVGPNNSSPQSTLLSAQTLKPVLHRDACMPHAHHKEAACARLLISAAVLSTRDCSGVQGKGFRANAALFVMIVFFSCPGSGLCAVGGACAACTIAIRSSMPGIRQCCSFITMHFISFCPKAVSGACRGMLAGAGPGTCNTNKSCPWSD